MSGMRVGLVCPYSLTTPGGVQGQVLGLARSLRNLGHDTRVLGPCDGPVLASSGEVVGPGGAELFRDANGGLRVAFHAWSGRNVGYPNPRYLRIGTLSTSSGQVTIST